ncbi:MAG: hypothetical protein NTW79_02590 [Candidatus Berkelbacteria bacterium]|nr:hypothetical protein [Candidatus Berkelbacteria bacterium]
MLSAENDLLAAAIAVAEVIRERFGIVLDPDYMPDPFNSAKLRHARNKWFDIERLKTDARTYLLLKGNPNWYDVFDCLECYTSQTVSLLPNGRISCPPSMFDDACLCF